jgi:protein-S-isoprenylcysteine O-methyltransferase Ste14
MNRLWLAVRSVFWVIVLPGFFGGFVPWRFFGVRNVRLDPTDPFHLAGLATFAAGALLFAACVFEFARTGRGTLSPVDPPRRLVVRGLYRYVRNPMYLSVSLAVIGQSLMVRSWALTQYVAALFIYFNLLVLLYEEPNLRRRFGAEYEAYTRAVGRWVPRRRPWPPASVASTSRPAS